MKLLKGPKGLVGAKLGNRFLDLECFPGNDRGYTVVSDKDAPTLIARGFEDTPIEKYPGNLDVLIRREKKYIPTTELSHSSTGTNPIDNHSSDTETQSTSSATTFEYTSTVYNPCILCRFKNWVSRKLKRS